MSPRKSLAAPTKQATPATPPRPLCLVGDVVLEDGSVLKRQHVLLAGGRIKSVTAAKPAGVKRADYTLRDDELIFPSFLDLHTHSSYNMLPLWHSPTWAWDNRFQWRANADYKQDVGGTVRGIKSAYGHGTRVYEAFSAFSELMALAGGTTVLQENAHLEASGYPGQSHYLIRDTGNPVALGLAATDEVVSITDFYEPDPYTAPRDPYQDTSHWGVKTVAKGQFDGATYVADFAVSVAGARTHATIVHLAEGRSGFLQTTLGPDAYTRREFEEFKAFITKNYTTTADIEKVRGAGLLLIHGCGMNTVSDRGLKRRAQPSAGAKTGPKTGPKPPPQSTIAETIDFLLTYGIGVIWSPVSNLLLYQDTTNILPLLDAGVPVILGTDWTPSGSKTVWEEAKFAAAFLEKQQWKGDVARTCFASVTSLAADALGLPTGRVREGNFADLAIVRRAKGDRSRDALGTFLKAGDEEVRAVLVGGEALYGDPAVLKALGAKPAPLPDESVPRERSHARGEGRSVASRKAFALPAGCPLTIEQLTEAVEAADHTIGHDRAKLLAADDPDYQSRMAELRQWVKRFDPKKSPNQLPPKPPKSHLAPGETDWMYNPSLDPADEQDPKVVELLGRIAPCRDGRCEVPKRHPFYHSEVLTEAGDSYGFRTPCMPVVPVLTTRKAIFAMGDYPTAKFTARSTNNLPVITDPTEIDRANTVLDALLGRAAAQPGPHPQMLQTYIEEIADLVRGAHARPDVVAADERRGHSWGKPPATPPRRNQFFVPVADVFAPMQDADYFDGYKVRDVAAGVFFNDQFLRTVGVSVEKQVWLTNMIKCFLFHDSMAASYTALGWTDVQVEQSYSELLPVAKVCSQWIDQEVVTCDPKLVLTVGRPPCTLLHDVPFADATLQGRVYNVLLGQLLPARDHRLERAVAKALHLSSSYPPPIPRGKGPAAPPPRATPTGAKSGPPPKVPVSIDRIGPWANYNVYHMMHPQAVMMSQTGASNGLLAAITFVLGPKAAGMGTAELRAELSKYLQRHRVAELLRTLPYGQRDQFRVNATLLETHAITLAGLADVLHGLGITHPAVSGATVLEEQATELVRKFHLADTPEEEHKKLVAKRREIRKRIDGYLHQGGAARR